MKHKKYIVIAAALIAMLALSLCGCADMQGAWAQMGIDAEKITSVTLVSGAGVLKPLSGQAMADFIAKVDALDVEATDNGYPNNDFEYAVRVTVDGKDGYCEYRIGAQVVAKDGFSGVKHAYCYLSDEQYEQIKGEIVKLFYA